MEVNEYLAELETFKIPHGKFPNLLMQKFGMTFDEADQVTEFHKQEMQEKEQEISWENSIL